MSHIYIGFFWRYYDTFSEKLKLLRWILCDILKENAFFYTEYLTFGSSKNNVYYFIPMIIPVE